MVSASSIDDPRVRTWMEIREPLERQLAPLGDAALSKLLLSAGDKVLDLGCGVGATPLALSQSVGPTGQVLGIELLQAAVSVASSDPCLPPHAAVVEGDVATYPFDGRSFDAAFSRFGVMFFHQPVAAFANILGAIRQNGKICFVCWRSLEENELDHLPLQAASPCLPAELIDQSATSSWFSFADQTFIHDTLSRAGWEAIKVEPRDIHVSTGDLQSTIDVCSRVGALGALLRQHPEYRTPAVSLLSQALGNLDGPRGPQLRAAIWIVSARAP
jgi:SAM-dependent methyltransferase